MRHITALLVCFIWSVEMPAQMPSASLLTPEEAIRIALANNYDIRLTQADASIAHANNTRGNAGMLPTVNLVANNNLTLSAFQQQLANGNEFNALGAPFNTLNAGVQLQQTLYDGRRMYIERDRLAALDQLGQYQLQQQIQTTSAAVLLAYAEVVRSTNLEVSIRQIIELNTERLRIAEARLAAGFAAQTDALTAQLDLQQRQSDLIQQQNATLMAKYTLNRLLIRDPKTPFEVDNTALSTQIPDRAVLIERLGSHNANLLVLNQNAQVTQLAADETRTLGSPRLTGIGQFNVARADNGAGFLKNNTQAGITIGLGLNMPIYSGGNLRRQQDVADLTNQQARLRVEAQRYQLEADLDQLLATAAAQNEVSAIETRNIDLARQNLTISTERFRLGQTNGLEVQVAQNTLEQALFRQQQAQTNLQVIVTRLRLIGGLL
jgi:outer membrane protein